MTEDRVIVDWCYIGSR